LQVPQAALAALAALALQLAVPAACIAAPQAATVIASSTRPMRPIHPFVTQLERVEGETRLAHSLIDSNRRRLPLEEDDPPRFLDADDINLDDIVVGGFLSKLPALDDSLGDEPLMTLPFGVTDGEVLDRFSLAGAEGLPEIGMDEDDIGPGDVVMVLGGLFAIGALVIRLRRGGIRLKTSSKQAGRGRRKIEVMSDSDFYPI
jgi:hypothetical protein